MARILRAPLGIPPRERVIPAAVFDARTRAAQIVADAERDAAAIREAARQEGLREGHEQAVDALGEARRAYDHALEAARADATEVALEVARRLLTAELLLAPEKVAHIVDDALSHVKRAQRIEVRLHPDDVPALEAHQAALSERLARPLHVQADPSLARGDCIVVSELGRIDARVSVKLDAIRRAAKQDSA